MLSGAGSNVLTVSNTETITGGAADDTVTLPRPSTTGERRSGRRCRSLTLANGTNSATVSNVETVLGGSGTDTITLGNVANTVAFSNVEAITGGTLADWSP